MTLEERFTNSVIVARDGERDNIQERCSAMLTSVEVIPCRHVEGQVRRDFFHLPQRT
jgi:hypothetical protein